MKVIDEMRHLVAAYVQGSISVRLFPVIPALHAASQNVIKFEFVNTKRKQLQSAAPAAWVVSLQPFRNCFTYSNTEAAHLLWERCLCSQLNYFPFYFSIVWHTWTFLVSLLYLLCI